MGNLEDTKQMSKFIIQVGTNEYVFSGGGGVEPGVPLPVDTVDSDSIIDGAVNEEDLSTDVKDRMTITHDASTGGIRIGGYAQAGNVPANNSQDVGQGGGEDSDDETGFENGAVDGESDI